MRRRLLFKSERRVKVDVETLYQPVFVTALGQVRFEDAHRYRAHLAVGRRQERHVATDRGSHVGLADEMMIAKAVSAAIRLAIAHALEAANDLLAPTHRAPRDIGTRNFPSTGSVLSEDACEKGEVILIEAPGILSEGVDNGLTII